MVPNADVPKLPFGLPSGGVFITLNVSARNCSATRSRTKKVLPAMRSSVWYPGPLTGLRELVPIVNCGAGANAEVSK